MLTFDNITHISTLIDDNEFFKQYYNDQALFKYDWNFFQLKFQPYLQEFKLIEEMHYVFSKQHHLDHMKFFWPDNTPLTREMATYFDQRGYQLQMLELFSLTSSQWKATPSPSLQIECVNDQTLEVFKQINFREDQLVSDAFAISHQAVYDQIYQTEGTSMYLASWNGQIVGSFHIYEQADILEIDHLLTVPEYRHRGIARSMIEFVVTLSRKRNKPIILLADAEDSTPEMYQKLGFQRHSYIIGALKELNE